MIIETKILTYSQQDADKAEELRSLFGKEPEVERTESKILIDLVSSLSFFEAPNGISLVLPNGTQYELPIAYEAMKEWYNNCLRSQYPNEVTTTLVNGSKMITQEQNAPDELPDGGEILIDYTGIINDVSNEYYTKSMSKEKFKDAIDFAIKKTLEQFM